MTPENLLPLKSKHSNAYLTSFLIAFLSGVVSISGLLYRDLFYPTEVLTQTFVPNDIINLFIGIPILLLSIFWTRRGKLIGLLFWEGALAFNCYIFINYSLALPISWKLLIYISLILLDLLTLYQLIKRIDGEKIANIYRDLVHEKLCGGILTGFGILFFLRAVFILYNALFNGGTPSRIELTTNMTDFIIAPAFVIVGISLWRKKALGYVGGLGLLFLVSMLFVGLILFLFLQPILTSTPFAPIDLIIIGILGSISFFPLALFIRGIRLSSKKLN